MIYVDQASTSSPKADGLGSVMASFIEGGGFTVARSSAQEAETVALQVIETRRRLARYFHAPDFRHVIFTGNITHSLNLVLKGLLRPGDHVLCSSMEHNAVMRPLAQLMHRGVEVGIIECDSYGRLDPADLEAAIRPNTRAVVMLAASNVAGTTEPVAAVGEICRRHHLFYILDTAQVAGTLPLDCTALGTDALCFTGHKGFRGPQGIGGVILSPALAEVLDPLMSGGTGSFSDSEELPPALPDRFEPGTPNLPGILGLGYAVSQVLEDVQLSSYRHEMALTIRFLQGLQNFPEGILALRGLPLEGAVASLQQIEDLLAGWSENAAAESSASEAPAASSGTAAAARGNGDGKTPPQLIQLPARMAVVSLQFLTEDNARVGFQLEEAGIVTRTGLHCAPRAHQTLGSFPDGTVRFSFGPKNTEAEIDTVLATLRQILL